MADILLMSGASGTGKSTIIKELQTNKKYENIVKAYETSARPFIPNVGKSFDEIMSPELNLLINQGVFTDIMFRIAENKGTINLTDKQGGWTNSIIPTVVTSRNPFDMLAYSLLFLDKEYEYSSEHDSKYLFYNNINHIIKNNIKEYLSIFRGYSLEHLKRESENPNKFGFSYIKKPFLISFYLLSYQIERLKELNFKILFFPIEFPLKNDDSLRGTNEKIRKETEEILLQLFANFGVEENLIFMTGSVEERMKKIDEILEPYFE